MALGGWALCSLGMACWSRFRLYCPHPGKGRVACLLESMVRVHCLQLFGSLSDSALEDVPYGVKSVRRLTGIRLETVAGRAPLSMCATCWRLMDWGGSCLRPSRRIWQVKV